MSSISRRRAPRAAPPRQLATPATAVTPATAATATTTAATHHERLEDHHLSVAHQLHDALLSRAHPEAHEARLQCTRVVDAVEQELCGAIRQAQILRGSLALDEPMELSRALRMLERAHDDAWRDLQSARNALLDGQLIEVRVALARVFSAIGRAEHAHHYVRTSTCRAISAMARAVSASSRRAMVMA